MKKDTGGRREATCGGTTFDVEKTFEKYTFEDIKFPKALCPDDLKDVTRIFMVNKSLLKSEPRNQLVHRK